MGDESARARGETASLEPTSVPPQRMQSKADPMRRFVPTPTSTDLPVMGRTVRLETNSAELHKHMVELFSPYSQAAIGEPRFLWQIVLESEPRRYSTWPRRCTFSDRGIRFAQFGQRSFLAVDLEAREAIAFVSEGLFEDRQGFTTPFIDTLFYLTAGALNLVPIGAACLRFGANALLVLGAPNQGKTTASYLAARDGLTIHADQSVFLETVDSELRAWGDFVPLAFRPETLQFLPEIKLLSRPFSYCEHSFHYMPKQYFLSEQCSFATPTCCLVLERGAASCPRLVPVSPPDRAPCLAGHVAFKDDIQFENQQRQVVAALARLPLYHLAYDANPASAAPFLRRLLMQWSYDPD